MIEKELVCETIGPVMNGIALAAFSFRDLRHKTIGVIPVAFLGAFNTVMAVYAGSKALTIVLGLLPGIFAILVSLITNGKMGLGDGLLLMALGPAYGWYGTLGIWLVALLTGALTGICLMIFKKANIKTALAFVPFIFVGFVFGEVMERVAL
jgi:leader peptidase (prepilin peptidase)/N-methyltransferase